MRLLYFDVRNFLKALALVCLTGAFYYGNLEAVLNESHLVSYHRPDYYIHYDSGLKDELLLAVHHADSLYHKKNLLVDSKEQIEEEIRLGEMELLAQLIQAEAGNQDLYGKRLVADVVLNRIEAGWGKSVEEIIFMDHQFSVMRNGSFDKAGWNIDSDSFVASQMEYEASERLDSKVLYFTAGNYNASGKPAYKYGNHYFSY